MADKIKAHGILTPDGKPIITSPWSTAKRIDNADFAGISYPDLKGMKATLVIPNDFYRKNIWAWGQAT